MKSMAIMTEICKFRDASLPVRRQLLAAELFSGCTPSNYTKGTSTQYSGWIIRGHYYQRLNPYAPYVAYNHGGGNTLFNFANWSTVKIPDGQISWSPNGDRIALFTRAGNTSRVRIYDLSGNVQGDFTLNNGFPDAEAENNFGDIIPFVPRIGWRQPNNLLIFCQATTFDSYEDEYDHRPADYIFNLSSRKLQEISFEDSDCTGIGSQFPGLAYTLPRVSG